MLTFKTFVSKAEEKNHFVSLWLRLASLCHKITEISVIFFYNFVGSSQAASHIISKIQKGCRASSHNFEANKGTFPFVGGLLAFGVLTNFTACPWIGSLSGHYAVTIG